MADSNSETPFAPSPALIAESLRLLRPLVRLMLQNRVSYPFFASLLKSLYVDVAAQDFKLEGKRLTASRLSFLTGVHRREVKRLQNRETTRGNQVPATISLGSQLVSRWTSDPEWLDDAGSPRALPRISREPGEPSFEGLVASASRDIHPRSVLDEWIRLGVVRMDSEDRVSLQRAAFVPARGFDEKAFFLGRNLSDHLGAACQNLMSDTPRFLERSVHYGALPTGGIDELRVLVHTAGEESLKRVNELARSIRDSAPTDGPKRRVNFGVFFYEEDIDETPPDASAEN